MGILFITTTTIIIITIIISIIVSKMGLNGLHNHRLVVQSERLFLQVIFDLEAVRQTPGKVGVM